MKKRDCDSVYIAGDVVTVIDPDVGQGWCQATCSDGREGVVPEVVVIWIICMIVSCWNAWFTRFAGRTVNAGSVLWWLLHNIGLILKFCMDSFCLIEFPPFLLVL